MGNIEELRRIASDTAGLVTLYYREQIQSIDSSQKIIGSNIINDTVNAFKQVYDVRPESAEEMAVVMVAEYINTWIIDELKLGNNRIDPTKPLPQQLWLCVAKKNPLDQGRMTKLTDAVGISTGQQKIPLKIKNIFGEEITLLVQLRYLIGCPSVVGNDGSIYQYGVPRDFSDHELNDLEQFGYVYVTPFSSDENALRSIVEGRKLNLAKRDEQGNILTRFEDIIEHVQTYGIQNDQNISKSLIVKETANQVAGVLREQKMFIDPYGLKEELDKVRETIELSIDVLREEIQSATQFYQLSINAAHEQIKQESEANRRTMKADNEIRYEEATNTLKEKLEDTEKRLEQLVQNRMNSIESHLQEKIKHILTIVETANEQSCQAVAQVNHATEYSRQLLHQATNAANSVQQFVQLSEKRQQEFQSKIKSYEGTMKEIANAQKESCERMILEIYAKIESDLKYISATTDESTSNNEEPIRTPQKSIFEALHIYRSRKNLSEVQKNTSKKKSPEEKNTSQPISKLTVGNNGIDGKSMQNADAGTMVLEKISTLEEKMNKISEVLENGLQQIENLTRKQDS